VDDTTKVYDSSPMKMYMFQADVNAFFGSNNSMYMMKWIEHSYYIHYADQIYSGTLYELPLFFELIRQKYPFTQYSSYIRYEFSQVCVYYIDRISKQTIHFAFVLNTQSKLSDIYIY